MWLSPKAPKATWTRLLSGSGDADCAAERMVGNPETGDKTSSKNISPVKSARHLQIRRLTDARLSLTRRITLPIALDEC